jgi:hypothetical protein
MKNYSHEFLVHLKNKIFINVFKTYQSKMKMSMNAKKLFFRQFLTRKNLNLPKMNLI